jgi:hypothetical protein
MEHTIAARFSGYGGMDIGRDNGLPSIAAMRTSRRSRSPARSRRSSSTSPHLTDGHKQELHEDAHQVLAMHAINA